MGNLVKLCRAGDRALQLLLFNEEFLVSVSHQLALITSLPFVHTARRYYRLNGLVISIGLYPSLTGAWPKPRTSTSGSGSTHRYTYLVALSLIPAFYIFASRLIAAFPPPLPPPYLTYPQTCAPLTLYGPLDQ